MQKPDELDATEAYAFLNVVAPKLEQLRQRLAVANTHLKAADPETARLNAILESQTAIREFLVGIPHLSPLIEPIDVLLLAVREEAAETSAGPPAAPPQEPEPPPVPRPLEPAPAPKQKPTRVQPVDTWLQIGTALAVEKLINAGIPTASAESQVEDIYATVGLREVDGSPISLDAIREWRSTFTGGRQRAWRGGALKRTIGARGVNAVVEARTRVTEMAAIFKKMAQLGANKPQ